MSEIRENLLENKRIRELLSSAEGARELAESLQKRGKDPVDVLATLADLHLELGQQLHEWVRVHVGPITTRAPSPKRRPPADEEATRVLKAVPEPTPEPLPEPTPEPLPEPTPVPVPEPLPQPDQADFFESRFQTRELREDLPYEDTEDTDEVDLSDVHALSSSRPAPQRDDPTEDLPAWLLTIDQLLISLAMPSDPETPTELAAECTRIQLSTVNMAARWSDYPEPLQLAVLGLLSCRARHLAERLQDDVGPKLALTRMRRYRKSAGLPPVVGLLSRQPPESGSWTRDALRWWEVLVEGLKPLQQQNPNGGIRT